MFCPHSSEIRLCDSASRKPELYACGHMYKILHGFVNSLKLDTILPRWYFFVMKLINHSVQRHELCTDDDRKICALSLSCVSGASGHILRYIYLLKRITYWSVRNNCGLLRLFLTFRTHIDIDYLHNKQTWNNTRRIL